jgi:hypothetical protein
MKCHRLHRLAIVTAGSLLVVCSADAGASRRNSHPGGAVPATTADEHKDSKDADRASAIHRAQVWTSSNIAAKDLKRGPEGPGAFMPEQTVRCEYFKKKMSGTSPKFMCRIGSKDKVKVKFGGANGEVFGEVGASRLLWALGFGADRMYPVKVLCRGCPDSVTGAEKTGGDYLVDPAAIERKFPGRDIGDDDQGWSWKELDAVSESAGGAPRAHVDALKLIAVFLQHTDSKSQQQRLVCLDPSRKKKSACAHPFMMVSDLGVTFGRADRTNSNFGASVNFDRWSHTPVWKESPGCTANLPKSITGTLENPVIGEAGRKFLAGLLGQLSDHQLRDLFEVSRFHLRPRSPGDGSSGAPSAQEWVDAFKAKRLQIVERRCA